MQDNYYNIFYKRNNISHNLVDIVDHLKCSSESIAKYNDITSYKLDHINIRDIKSLKQATEKDISFLTSAKYIDAFNNTKAAVCFVAKSVKNFIESKNFNVLNDTIIIYVENTQYTYAKLLELFYSYEKKIDELGCVMPSAFVSSKANIGKNCYIGHNVVIEDHVKIGNDVVIDSGAIIGNRVQIGDNVNIGSNAVINCSVIGSGVKISHSSVIGKVGFGFTIEKDKKYRDIMHIGKVQIGDNVNIGASTTIDRGSVGDTIIEDDCRIDNLVQIAHNVIIKQGTVIAAQVGIAGSTTIGRYCMIGGQAGIAGHLNIADGVHVAAKTGIMSDITEKNSVVGGIPAKRIRDWHKQTILLNKMLKDKG